MVGLVKFALANPQLDIILCMLIQISAKRFFFRFGCGFIHFLCMYIFSQTYWVPIYSTI